MSCLTSDRILANAKRISLTTDKEPKMSASEPCPHCKYGYATGPKCSFCGGTGVARTPSVSQELSELGFATDEAAQTQEDSDILGPRPVEHKEQHARAGRSYSTAWWNR